MVSINIYRPTNYITRILRHVGRIRDYTEDSPSGETPRTIVAAVIISVLKGMNPPATNQIVLIQNAMEYDMVVFAGGHCSSTAVCPILNLTFLTAVKGINLVCSETLVYPQQYQTL